MLYIEIDATLFSLHVGQESPAGFHDRLKRPFQVSVTADGDELSRIAVMFTGIRFANCSVVEWQGDDAVFIARHWFRDGIHRNRQEQQQ